MYEMCLSGASYSRPYVPAVGSAVSVEYWTAPGSKTLDTGHVFPSSNDTRMVPFRRAPELLVFENRRTLAAALPLGALGNARMIDPLLCGSTRVLSTVTSP